MPAKAGIQNYLKTLDSRLRGNDAKGRFKTFYETINFQSSIFNSGLSGLGLGHHLQGFLQGIIDFGKPRDSHHSKNFFKMVGDAGNSNGLIVLFGLGENLDKYRNAATVDIDISLGLQQDMGCTLFGGIFVSVVQEGFGKGRYVPLDVQQCYGTVLFEPDLFLCSMSTLHFLIPAA